MDDQPRIVARAVQPYVAVTERVTLDQFPGAIDRGFAEVFGWLAAHDGRVPGGCPVDSLRRGGHGRELARRPSGTSRGRAPFG